MSSAAPQSTTSTPLPLEMIKAAFSRGLAKASSNGLVAYKSGTDYLVPSSSESGVEYRVSWTGPAWHQWSCSCKAGQHGTICQHVAVACFAKKHRVHAVRPLRLVPTTRHDEAARLARVNAEMDALFS